MADNTRYYYFDESGQHGPLPLNELVSKIKPQTDVWSQDLSSWTPAKDVPEVANALAAYNQQIQSAAFNPTVENTSTVPPEIPQIPAQGFENQQQDYNQPQQDISQPQPQKYIPIQNDNQYQQQGNQYQQQGYNQQQQGYLNPDNDAKAPNFTLYIVLSILSAVFCCLIGGIVAVYQTTEAKKAYQYGNIASCNEKLEKAKTWMIVSAVIGIISLVLNIIVNFR
ncbi:MAG: CD225/dispanin family protein [Bacteroidales bacterium]|nr:CD225/dispanin family protein [Bacteroidales bacterium]